MELFNAFFCCGGNPQLYHDDINFEIKSFPCVRLTDPVCQKNCEVAEKANRNSLGQVIPNARVLKSEGDIMEIDQHNEEFHPRISYRKKEKACTSTKKRSPITSVFQIASNKAIAKKELLQDIDLEEFNNKMNEDFIEEEHKAKNNGNELYRSLDFMLKEAHTQIKEKVDSRSRKTIKNGLSRRSESSNTSFLSKSRQQNERSTAKSPYITTRVTVIPEIEQEGFTERLLVPSENSSFSFCPSVVSLELANKFKLDATIITAIEKAKHNHNGKPYNNPYATADTPGMSISYNSSTKSLRLGIDSPFPGPQV